jgi:addiction module RelE/StbE family toxin
VALKILWSQEAIDDMDSIATYIEKDSPAYAKAVVKTFFSKAEILIDFPLLGRIVPEYQNENIRELFIYSYRLIYNIEHNAINIIAIIHGKRLI